MKKSNNNQYISLTEAAKCCDYSQEYLSLRARQGKLEAMKFGRNWVTKKEWLKQYIARAKEYNDKLAEKQGKNIKTVPVTKPPVRKKPKFQLASVKKVQPPANLPIENINFKPLLVALLAVALFVSSVAFGSKSFRPIKEFTVNIYSLMSQGIKTVGSSTGVSANLAEDFTEKANKTKKDIIFNSYILAETGDIITENTAELFQESFATVTGDVNRMANSENILAGTIRFFPKTVSSMKMAVEETIKSPEETLLIISHSLDEAVIQTNRNLENAVLASAIKGERCLSEKVHQKYDHLVNFSNASLILFFR